MLVIKDSEKLVLLALRGSDYGMSQWGLVQVTGLSLPNVRRALGTLSRSCLIFEQEKGGQQQYEPVELSTQPLVDDYRQYLLPYVTAHTAEKIEDRRSDVLSATSLVLITAIVTGERDESTIAQLTGLRTDFVLLMVELAIRVGLWGFDQAFRLEMAITQDAATAGEVETALELFNRAFWDVRWPGMIEKQMTALYFGEAMPQSSGMTDCIHLVEPGSEERS